MRIGHYIQQLNPFGMERVLESLLRHRSPLCREQFVVSRQDGPMRTALERLGVPVSLSRSDRETAGLLRRADVVNLHLGSPEYCPETVSRRFPRPRVITIHWPAAFPAGLAQRFIATSHSAWEMQPDRRRCDLIPNGIDVERWPARLPPEEPACRTLLRTCRPERSDEFLWYALLPLLAEFPQARLWLAGTEGKSSERVQVLGVLSDLAPVLARADLFVHTPREGEGTRDLVVMEAMAAGLACVLADVPAVREAVCDSGAVRLVPFGDVEACREAIRELLLDPELAMRLGREARLYARTHFDVRRRVTDYERVYRELAG